MQSGGAKPEVEIIEGNDVSGILGIKTHWPSMVRTVYGDHTRFMNTCECLPTSLPPCLAQSVYYTHERGRPVRAHSS